MDGVRGGGVEGGAGAGTELAVVVGCFLFGMHFSQSKKHFHLIDIIFFKFNFMLVCSIKLLKISSFTTPFCLPTAI